MFPRHEIVVVPAASGRAEAIVPTGSPASVSMRNASVDAFETVKRTRTMSPIESAFGVSTDGFGTSGWSDSGASPGTRPVAERTPPSASIR